MSRLSRNPKFHKAMRISLSPVLLMVGALLLLSACSTQQLQTPLATLERRIAAEASEPLLSQTATTSAAEQAGSQVKEPTVLPRAENPSAPAAPPEPTLLPLITNLPQIATRLGFGDAGGTPDDYPEAVSMRAGWYLDWDARVNPVRPNGMEYAQMVRIHQDITCPIASTNAHNRALCPYVMPHSYTYSPNAATIQQIAQANVGSLWLIGNEIERKDWPGGHQDEILPELYAVAYHELYTMIKAADPLAQVAIGGVIQATPLRRKYLDRILTHYQTTYSQKMPVDVWNIHAFVLPEKANVWGQGNPVQWGADIPVGLDETVGTYIFHTDANGNLLPTMPEHIQTNLVDEQIRAFRQWMKDHGEQGKPLIVSEYSVLLPNSSLGLAKENHQPIVDFLLWSFDYFLDTKDCTIGYVADDCRLVQRWVWYSMDDVVGFNEHQALFDPVTRQISPAGIAVRQYVQEHLSKLAKRPY